MDVSRHILKIQLRTFVYRLEKKPENGFERMTSSLNGKFPYITEKLIRFCFTLKTTRNLQNNRILYHANYENSLIATHERTNTLL